MATSKSKKADILKKITEDFKKAKAIVFAANTGITVEDFEILRGDLREKNISCYIACNGRKFDFKNIIIWKKP